MHTRNRLTRATAVIVLAVALVVLPAGGAAADAAAGLTMRLLPVPAGLQYSAVNGGEHSGRYLVGTGKVSDDFTQPLVALQWINGQVSTLDTAALAPYFQVHAADVNRQGTIVGYRIVGCGTCRTEGWVYRDGRFTMLPGLQPTDGTQPVAINARGDIVGISKDDTAFHAVIWPAGRPAGVRELTVGGQSPPWAVGVDIDDDGTVLGFLGNSPSADQQPYVWPARGEGYPLVPPAGTAYPEAVAIHNGWVAGTAAVEGQLGTLVVRWNLRTGTSAVISSGLFDRPVAVNRQGTVATTSTLIYRNGRQQVLGGYIKVLNDDGTAAGSDQYYLSGNAVRWTR